MLQASCLVLGIDQAEIEQRIGEVAGGDIVEGSRKTATLLSVRSTRETSVADLDLPADPSGRCGKEGGGLAGVPRTSFGTATSSAVRRCAGSWPIASIFDFGQLAVEAGAGDQHGRRLVEADTSSRGNEASASMTAESRLAALGECVAADIDDRDPARLVDRRQLA